MDTEPVITKRLTAKDRIKIRIIEHLSDPSNGFPPWKQLCTEVFHYKSSRYFYKLFTIEERSQIIQTALEERRRKSAPLSAAVDHALFKKALAGDTAAIKLWYQKMEGWSEKKLRDGPDEDSLQKIALQMFILNCTTQMSNDERARLARKRLLEEVGPETESQGSYGIGSIGAMDKE